MKLLALDSSGLVASAAVLEDEVLLAEYTVNYKKTHSQTLLPMLDEIARMIELDLSEVDAVAVAAGPGSFTGLRIGSATAKGLGLALGRPVIEVPTLAAMAYGLFGAAGLLCPIMDARRSQVYSGIYRFEQASLVTVRDQEPKAVSELCAELTALLGRFVNADQAELNVLAALQHFCFCFVEVPVRVDHKATDGLIVADEGLDLCEEGVLKLCVGSPVVAEFQHQVEGLPEGFFWK